MPEIRSVVAGASWPALADPDSAGLLAVLFQLERSQWLSPEEIQARQLGQLSQLLCHAAHSVPFYRDRLPATGRRPAHGRSSRPRLLGS